MAAVPEILDEVSLDGLKRLCDLRDLRRSGRRAELETSLARSYRGDADALIADLRKEDLKRVLEGEWTAALGDYSFAYLAQASVEDLRELTSLCFVKDWHPTEDGERPLGAGCPVTVRLLDDDDDDETASDGDDDDDSTASDWDDEDDDDSTALDSEDDDDSSASDWDDEDDEDEDRESFATPEYAEQLRCEYEPAPQHEKLVRNYQEEALTALKQALDPKQPVLLYIGTGGGKTFVANELVHWYLNKKGGPILWITKDWHLLKQASRDLCRRGRVNWAQLSRVGGDKRVLHPFNEYHGQRNCIIYTTLQTFSHRRVLWKPALVVWDESHWGEHGKTGRKLLARARQWQAPVVGLTATPRGPEKSQFKVAFRKTFFELVEDGALARPEQPKKVSTGTNWDPVTWTGKGEGDFTQTSLAELGRDSKRNKRIVEEYVRGGYGKTILFACSIEHADRLARLLSDAGVSARPIHSRRSIHENNEDIAAFERNEVRVLVNVAKLIYGIDLPDARTVFLCRPTMSDILFSQMVGRASRLDQKSGKETFAIVEFSDNLSRFGDQLVTAKAFFEGTQSRCADAEPRAGAPSSRDSVPLEFDPLGACRWIGDREPTSEAMRGLWVRDGQTFGIEFELTGSQYRSDMDLSPGGEWYRIAEELRRALSEALPGKVGPSVFCSHGEKKDYSLWNVEYDSSVGWEIISRKLKNQEGYEEVVVACAALESARKSLGLKVNHRTGTHVHLGWLGKDTGEVLRAIRLARLFEPALATLVSPSRIVEFCDGNYDTSSPNAYCRPVASCFSLTKLRNAVSLDDLWKICRDDESRYVTFNILPLDTYQTVEARLHNGTLDAGKILLWLSLWQQILWAASQMSHVDEVADASVLVPQGDIIQLAKRYLPQVPRRFLLRLEARRREIVEIWKQYVELEHWVAFSHQWISPTRLYFAYGSNLDSDQLRQRCPSARLVGTAYLLGFRIAFAGTSRRWGTATATLTQDAASTVPGLLYELTDADFDSLDLAEGSRYECEEIDVVDLPGNKRRALTYRLRNDEPVGVPQGEYLSLVLGAYKRLGFDVRTLPMAAT